MGQKFNKLQLETKKVGNYESRGDVNGINLYFDCLSHYDSVSLVGEIAQMVALPISGY